MHLLFSQSSKAVHCAPTAKHNLKLQEIVHHLHPTPSNVIAKSFLGEASSAFVIWRFILVLIVLEEPFLPYSISRNQHLKPYNIAHCPAACR